MRIDLGAIGIWQRGHFLDTDLARLAERLGYGAIWIGGSPPGDLRLVGQVLDATSRIVVATGIVNIWRDDAATVAASYHRIAVRHRDRFVLGIGAGHPEQDSGYTHAYSALVHYLDALDAAEVPVDRRALAALGPRTIRLAGDRSAGAHPYLTTPAHTKLARDILGDEALLAPEQKVVLTSDPLRAREIGRPYVRRPYLALRNYTENLLRIGYSEQDLANGGSDRLIDDLVLHGEPAAVALGVAAHLEAGADHVAIQVLGDDLAAVYRALAAELL